MNPRIDNPWNLQHRLKKHELENVIRLDEMGMDRWVIRRSMGLSKGQIKRILRRKK